MAKVEKGEILGDGSVGALFTVYPGRMKDHPTSISSRYY